MDMRFSNRSASRIVPFAALLIIAGLTGCRNASVERYELKGKVVSVDKRGSAVTIAHEAIPGYMEAMTMAFTLDDQRLLNEIAEGDRIQATLVVGGRRARLEDVIVTREAVDTANIATAAAAVEPAIGGEVPDFAFTVQDGKRVSFKGYRGRVVVLTFIYTRCPLPDYCPLMTDNFAEIQEALKPEPRLYARTQLISLTVDPEYDSPAVLRDYGVAHSADSRLWLFGTGTKDQMKAIATWFGLQYWPDGDQIVHSLRTAIIDADGKLVKLYRGNEWKPDEIVAELRKHAPAIEKTGGSHIYRGLGVVESIDRESATLEINHEEIKGLMPAMSMPFRLKDKGLVEGIEPGDKVDFWIESASGDMVVIRLRKR
jgi:protein SCO1/2